MTPKNHFKRNCYASLTMLHVSILLCILCLGFKCKTLPPEAHYKKITLNLVNFIGNCKAGDLNGISTEFVSYLVTVKVYLLTNGSRNSIAAKNYINLGPSSLNLATFTTEIEVPYDKPFYLEIAIDGQNCSLCAIDCKSIFDPISNIYSNVGRPYWYWMTFFPDYGIPSSSYSVTPTLSPRNPSSAPKCDCQIKN